MFNTLLIAFVGPSGAGKSTLANSLRETVPELVSHTTRKPRDGEQDGINYYYVTKEKFDTFHFIERVEYSDNYYGLAQEEFDAKRKISNILCVVVERNGLYALAKHFTGTDVAVVGVFVKCSLVNLVSRMVNRGDPENFILRRLANIYETKELELPDGCKFVVSTDGQKFQVSEDFRMNMLAKIKEEYLGEQQVAS